MRGYTLLEVSVMMAVFGVFLMLFFGLTAEMRGWEKRLPINFLKHPQVTAMTSRLRRDVLDAYIPTGSKGPYVKQLGKFEMSDKVLILNTIQTDGTLESVVWDFSEPGVAYRHAYVKEFKTSTWTARGLPQNFAVDLDAVELLTGRPYGVRIMAVDEKGRLAIDQILQPRAHK